jgi:hypothetical protein
LWVLVGTVMAMKEAPIGLLMWLFICNGAVSTLF